MSTNGNAPTIGEHLRSGMKDLLSSTFDQVAEQAADKVMARSSGTNGNGGDELKEFTKTLLDGLSPVITGIEKRITELESRLIQLEQRGAA